MTTIAEGTILRGCLSVNMFQICNSNIALKTAMFWNRRVGSWRKRGNLGQPSRVKYLFKDFIGLVRERLAIEH